MMLVHEPCPLKKRLDIAVFASGPIVQQRPALARRLRALAVISFGVGVLGGQLDELVSEPAIGNETRRLNAVVHKRFGK